MALMPNHIALLSDAEARRLATGTLFVVRPVTPQPEYESALVAEQADGSLFGRGPFHEKRSWSWWDYHHRLNWSCDTEDDLCGCLREHNPLGAPGDTLLCKEAWAFTRDIDEQMAEDGCTPGCLSADDVEGQWFYRATEEPPLYPHIGKWRPASRMPLWAVRHRAVVTEAGVMRLGEVGGRQAMDAGMRVPAHMPQDGADYDWARPAFAAYWNRRYPKYPYEQSPWVWWASVKREEHNA